MFGRKKDLDHSAGATTASATLSDELANPTAKSQARKEPPLPPRPVTNPAVAAARRPLPAPVRMLNESPASGAAGRRLVVGREILLRGEVTSCDALVVEGEVELTATDARQIQVVAGGIFRGSIEVEEADIAGCYEGAITVKNRLTVRTGGRVVGTVRYGTLVVEAGGQVSGGVDPLGGLDGAVQAPTVSTLPPLRVDAPQAVAEPVGEQAPLEGAFLRLGPVPAEGS